MKKRILEYRTRIDKLLISNDEDTDWNAVMEEHLTQIGFFQHERLIHLLVTILFAILTFICVAAYIISGAIYVLALIGILLVLLVPYIMHYYLLENGVQKMYNQYDKLLELSVKKENKDSHYEVFKVE